MVIVVASLWFCSVAKHYRTFIDGCEARVVVIFA